MIGLTVEFNEQVRDTAAVPRIPRSGLRADVVGCYAMTGQPPLPARHEVDLVPFELMELDTTSVIPGYHHRWAYTKHSAVARVYFVPPLRDGPLFVAWYADSLTDTLTLVAELGRGGAHARVVRTDDGGLEGTAYHAWEGGSAELGPVSWTARTCAGLELDRRIPP